MPFMVGMRIDGVKETQEALRSVKSRFVRKHLKKAMGKAGRLVLWSARAGVKASLKQRTKLLYRSLGRQVKTSRATGVVRLDVGARKGFKKVIGIRKRAGVVRGKTRRAGQPIYADPTKYLHLVELGTKRGVAGRHFLQRALDQNRGKIASLIAEALAQAMAEASSKGASPPGGK